MDTVSLLAGAVLAFVLAEYVRHIEDRAYARGRLSLRLEHIGREGGK